MGSQEFVGADPLYRVSVDVEGGRVCFVPPKIYDYLLIYFGIESEVIPITPLSQLLHLCPVGRLIPVGYETHQGDVVCILVDGLGRVGGSAVMGVGCVQERA